MPTDCIAKDFESRWYKKWSKKIGYPPARHAKFWETAAIAEALANRGMLRPGKRGLGMGVGDEQLTSLLASYGATITATDQDPHTEKAKKWDNGQLAKAKPGLFYPHIVDADVFDTNVEYQNYDMTTLNKAFAGQYDFAWHNCVIGHLGSLAEATTQLKRSAQYLKEGGWLVFTTELNISSLEHTIGQDSDTVVWRLKDLYELFAGLEKEGLTADRFRLRLGSDPEDLNISYNHIGNIYQPPGETLQNPAFCEIKIPFSNIAITQILLCFQKTGRRSRLKSLQRRQDYQANMRAMLSFAQRSADTNDYFHTFDDIEYSDALLMPEHKEPEVVMQAGSTRDISLRFLNRSDIRLFDFSMNTPFSRPPLVLATFNPVNRESAFSNGSWASPNRPAFTFYHSDIRSESAWNPHRAGHGEWFGYQFGLTAPDQPGTYHESFVLVFEGKGVVLSSVVNLTIRVEAKKRPARATKRTTYTAPGYLKKIGLADALPGGKAIAREFADWLQEFGKRQFAVRLNLTPLELLTFLEEYLQTYRKTALPPAVRKSIMGNRRAYIGLHQPALLPNLSARVVYIVASPRVGGTVIAETLAQALGWQHIASGSDAFGIVDTNRLSGSAIIHTHELRDDFLPRLPAGQTAQVITVARNPLDTLVSGYKFAQHVPECLDWLDGKVFQTVPKPKSGTLADDKTFMAWAGGDGGKAMLAVTPSWWRHADATIRYEDFMAHPVRTTMDILAAIDPQVSYDRRQITGIVKRIQAGYLKDAKRPHRWNGGSGYAEKLLKPNDAALLKETHAEVFETLGYR